VWSRSYPGLHVLLLEFWCLYPDTVPLINKLHSDFAISIPSYFRYYYLKIVSYVSSWQIIFLLDTEPSLPVLQDLVVSSYDHASLSHTPLPVPAQLTVKPSHLPGATLGVFAVSPISNGVRIGPYKGKKVGVEEAGKLYNTAYAWEVSEQNLWRIFNADTDKPTSGMTTITLSCMQAEGF